MEYWSTGVMVYRFAYELYASENPSQMEAIEVTDGIAAINLERCIGCGLCVTTCPPGAIELIKKPEDQLYEPPKTGAETYIQIMQERGKI